MVGTDPLNVPLPINTLSPWSGGLSHIIHVSPLLGGVLHYVTYINDGQPGCTMALWVAGVCVTCW